MGVIIGKVHPYFLLSSTRTVPLPTGHCLDSSSLDRRTLGHYFEEGGCESEGGVPLLKENVGGSLSLLKWTTRPRLNVVKRIKTFSGSRSYSHRYGWSTYGVRVRVFNCWTW